MEGTCSIVMEVVLYLISLVFVDYYAFVHCMSTIAITFIGLIWSWGVTDSGLLSKCT